MVVRRSGKDVLQRRRLTGLSTYWIGRDRLDWARDTLEDQFWLPEGEAMMLFFSELWTFMKVRKKFWLFPIVIVMTLFGGLVVLTQGSVVAPFIYALF
jgi:hypothetical protein